MRLPDVIRSVPRVCEVDLLAAPDAGPTPDLLIEIPHGATRKADYDAIRSLVSPSLPEDLIDFFFVNTDVGSWEYGRRIAELVCFPPADPDWDRNFGRIPADASRPRSALIVRCLIPRTFIDANRIVGAEADRAAGLTAALAEYIRDPGDQQRLGDLHASYHAVTEAAYQVVCGNGGLAVTPHTYAPKSVSITSFDEGIGAALRRAYEPALYETWKTRPQIDLITRTPEDEFLAPEGLVTAVRKNCERLGFEIAENESYPLHPATMGAAFSRRYPQQVLCLEVRRDLLADPFTPFAEMRINPAKTDRVAGPIAAAVLEYLAR